MRGALLIGLITLALVACETEHDDPMAGDLQTYIGKTALLGITYEDSDGSIRDQIQVYGTIINLDDSGGLVVRPADGSDDIVVPPFLEPAQPGQYRLKKTGEVVVDPDFIGTWTVNPPDKS